MTTAVNAVNNAVQVTNASAVCVHLSVRAPCAVGYVLPTSIRTLHIAAGATLPVVQASIVLVGIANAQVERCAMEPVWIPKRI